MKREFVSKKAPLKKGLQKLEAQPKFFDQLQEMIKLYADIQPKDLAIVRYRNKRGMLTFTLLAVAASEHQETLLRISLQNALRMRLTEIPHIDIISQSQIDALRSEYKDGHDELNHQENFMIEHGDTLLNFQKFIV
jgi:hypothetical protein